MKPVSPVLLRQRIEETTFAEKQPEYEPLPAVRTIDGTVTARWRMTWRERLKVFVRGSVWTQQLTFNRPLQPLAVTADEPQFEIRIENDAPTHAVSASAR